MAVIVNKVYYNGKRLSHSIMSILSDGQDFDSFQKIITLFVVGQSVYGNIHI